MVSEEGLHVAGDGHMVSEERLHAADHEIWCQKKDYMMYIMKYGVHAVDYEIRCQKKGCMLQMMKYGVRRRITCSI